VYVPVILGLTVLSMEHHSKAMIFKGLKTGIFQLTPVIKETPPKDQPDETGVTPQQHEELSRSATKGNVAAIRELFDYGERTYKLGHYEKAAAIYKDAAICFRLEAFRRRTDAEDANSRAKNQAKRIAVLTEALKRKHDFSRILVIHQRKNVSSQDVHSVLYEKIFPNSDYSVLLDDLFAAFIDAGYQFSAPGNSFPRLIWFLVSCTLGAAEIDPYKCRFLSDPLVGIPFEKLMATVLENASFD
jgi:hypothetical protein